MTIVFLPYSTASRGCKDMKRTLKEMYNIDTLIYPTNDIPNGIDLLIRWGSYKDIHIDTKYILNNRQSIMAGSNKPLARKILKEYGVSIPKTYNNTLDINVLPVIGRQRHHHGGNNLEFITTVEGLASSQSEYWSEYIPKDHEYRIYIFMNRILGVCEKIPENKEAIVWNHNGGNSVFKTIRWGSFPLDVCSEALKACNAIKTNFSAVDIITYKDKPYVLELNSAPSLSPYRLELFSKAFKYVIDYIKDNDKLPYNKVPESINHYKDIIHECLLNENKRII